MNDWLRSLAALGMAFVAVLTATLGLAGAFVPGEVAGPPGAGTSDGPRASATPPPALGRPGLGGTLAVSGDREGEFRLTRESIENRYSLTGGDGRISFEGQPVEVAQLSYDGLEFFPDPEDCTVTPLNLDTAIGVGQAQLDCADLEDIRGNGVISLAGEIGLPVDMLAERSLPHTGGTLAVGPETWTIESAFLFTWQMPAIAGAPEYNLDLVDEVAGAGFHISYDVETHALAPAAVDRIGESRGIDPDACTIQREELGKQNPRTTVIEVTISCPEVEVPGLGAVPIEGTVVVDELAWPE